ncbi:MAG: hypothetical protein OXF23_00565, partial [Candidatus Dadabacteria bacterium]|nr:hypothetical protein [Candidatus Dadabacteria bacterium]
MKASQSDGRHEGSDYRLPMLQAHFARIAERLEAEGRSAKSFDHSTNRGLVREAFIREFLSQNTSPLTGIGTGEIIHSGSAAGDPRRQLDVVIHNNRYPKISLATGIDLFLIETVSCFIEIKSCLRKEHIQQAASTSKEVMNQARPERQTFNPTGMVDKPRPYSFVFAYDGPSNIETVFRWMKEISANDQYNVAGLVNTEADERPYFNHLFIDGVFVLGKGYVLLDALPSGSGLHAARRCGRSVTSDHVWIHGTD